MSTLARQVLGAARKRKERDGSDGFKAPPNKAPAEPVKPVPKLSPKPSPLARSERPALPVKNRLLAGYLAHEFLTKGTLFGQPFDPALSEPVSKPAQPDQSKPKAYADVAHLLKFDGTHIPGIVNPTQLGCWIQKGKI